MSNYPTSIAPIQKAKKRRNIATSTLVVLMAALLTNFGLASSTHKDINDGLEGKKHYLCKKMDSPSEVSDCINKVRSFCNTKNSEPESLECFNISLTNLQKLLVSSRRKFSESDSLAEKNGHGGKSEHDVEEEFGLQKESSVSEQHIESLVIKVEENAIKERYFWLENGHIWHESSRRRLSIKAGDHVTIEKGAFDSYTLKKANTNTKIKVKRVK